MDEVVAEKLSSIEKLLELKFIGVHEHFKGVERRFDGIDARLDISNGRLRKNEESLLDIRLTENTLLGQQDLNDRILSKKCDELRQNQEGENRKITQRDITIFTAGIALSYLAWQVFLTARTALQALG